jgi:antitoxin VapB
MALNIRNPEAKKLAEAVTALTGETKTQPATEALRERLETRKRRKSRCSLGDRLDEVGKYCAALPILDACSPDEMLGCDECGLPS